MSDEQISLLERYLLEEDKEKFFGTLVKNSETYINMRLLDHINRYGLDLPKDSESDLKAFLSESKNKKSLIQFKHQLLAINQESDPKKRKTLIDQFNKDFMKVNFTFSRPANVKQSDNLRSMNEFKLPSEYSDEKFSLATKMEEFFNQSDWNKIKDFKPHFYYKFDLQRLLDKKVDCFEHVLNSLTSLTHVKVGTAHARTSTRSLRTMLLTRERSTKDSLSMETFSIKCLWLNSLPSRLLLTTSLVIKISSPSCSKRLSR